MPRRPSRLFRREGQRIRVEFTAPEQMLPVPIVNDGLIGNGLIGYGRLFPAVVVDTSDRPDLDDILAAHVANPDSPGEVRAIWTPTGKCRLDLILDFREPIATVAILALDAVSQASLIDQINFAGGLWVFNGRADERVSEKLIGGLGGILVEVGPYSRWDSMFRSCLERDFRKRGLGRRKARATATGFIDTWRETFRTRFGVAKDE